MDEFITIKEASKIAGKSELTIRRLIKKALLSPTDRKLIKREPQSNSKNSPFVYKLHKSLITQVSSQVISQMITQAEPLTSQARGKHKGGATQVSSQMISQMGDTIGILKAQLEVKDTQIKDLSHKVGEFIERQRETNILLKGLQDKMLLLEAHREPKSRGEIEQNLSKPIKMEQKATKSHKTGRKGEGLQLPTKRSPQGLLSRITGTFTGFWGHRDALRGKQAKQGRSKEKRGAIPHK
jgi:hypothetical protein